MAQCTEQTEEETLTMKVGDQSYAHLSRLLAIRRRILDGGTRLGGNFAGSTPNRHGRFDADATDTEEATLSFTR